MSTDTSYERLGLTEAPRCPDPDCNGPLWLDITDCWHCADCATQYPESEEDDTDPEPRPLESDELADLEHAATEERAQDYES